MKSKISEWVKNSQLLNCEVWLCIYTESFICEFFFVSVEILKCKIYIYQITDVFVLKLRERLLKSVKITLKKIVKSILRCQKAINFTEKFFSKELCKEWFAHTTARIASPDDNNNNNTHLFFLLSVKKFKSFLLNLGYKTHVNASLCTVELWMHLGDVLEGLLSLQELKV